ncbi:hypothetical protein BG006_003666, partial [Podila minutissima]
ARSQGGSGAEEEVYGMVGAAIGQIHDVVLEGIKQEYQSSTEAPLRDRSNDCCLSAAATFRITSEDTRVQSDVICLVMNKDSTLAMMGSADGTAKLINLHSSNILGLFENHTAAVGTIGFLDHLKLIRDQFTRRPPQHLGRADDVTAHVM